MVNHIPLDTADTADTAVPRYFKAQDDQVTYHLFTRENTEKCITIDPSEPVQLRTNKRIIFVVHGWTENRHRLWYEEMKKALLKNDDVYVVQVDYEEVASQNYVAAVLSVPDVGKFVQNRIHAANGAWSII